MICCRGFERLQSQRVGRVGRLQQELWGGRDGATAGSAEARAPVGQALSAPPGDQVVRQRSGLYRSQRPPQQLVTGHS